MNSTNMGKEAEKLVALRLKKLNHKILCMNWRTKWCEIDIVSKKKKTVYFTEVKYRNSDRWGTGFDYIGPKKIQQIQFAAELWIADNDWTDDSMLLGAEVDSNGEISIIEIS